MITFLSILGILALLGAIASLGALLTDGYRPVPTDWSRVRERRDEPELDPIVAPTPVAPTRTVAAAHAARPRRRTRGAARRVRTGATR